MECLYYNKDKSNIIGDELALDRYIYTNRDEFISMLDTVDLTLSVSANLKDNATQADVVSFIETMHREEQSSSRGVATTDFWNRYDINIDYVDIVQDPFKRDWIARNSNNGWTAEEAEQKYKEYKKNNPSYNHIGDAISKALEFRLSGKNKDDVIKSLQSWVKEQSAKRRREYTLFKNDILDNNFYNSVYDAVDQLIGYLHKKFGNDCKIMLETGLSTNNISDSMLSAMKAIQQVKNSTTDVDVLTGRVDITVIKSDGTVHTIEMKSHREADWNSVHDLTKKSHKYQVSTYDLIRRQRKINTTPYLLLMTRTDEGFIRFNGDSAFLQVGTNESEYLDAQTMIPLEAKLTLDNVDNSHKAMSEFFGGDTGLSKSLETLKRDVDHWMDVNNNMIKPVTTDMKNLWDKGHRFYYVEYRNGRKITKSAKTREDLRSDIADYVNYLNTISFNALTTFAKEFKYVRTTEDLRNLLKRNGYIGESIDTMTNHLWKYINGWTLSDNLALISNGFLLFRKGGRSEIVMFTESKSLKTYHKFSKIGDRTTILGNLYRDNEAGSGNTQILSAQYGNLMLMKAMAIIADNPEVFKSDKISSISAINPRTGDVLNTVTNKKLNDNWKMLVHKFKKSNLPLIDNCFMDDVEASVYRARDWVDLTEGQNIANHKGALIESNTNFSAIAFNSEITEKSKEQIQLMIKELINRFGKYSDSMDYRLKRAFSELNKALLSLNGYSISPENDVASYFDQGFTMTGALMAPFYRSNSANLREFSRISNAFHYKLNEEIQKAVAPFQVKLNKVLESRSDYSDAIGGEHNISNNWFVRNEKGEIHEDFRVIPPYDPKFPGSAAEAELLDYVLETFAKWRWGNTDYSHRKADPTSDYYKMPLYESGWVETIDTSDNKVRAVISLGKKKIKRTVNVTQDLLYGQDWNISGHSDPETLNLDEVPNPLHDKYRKDKLQKYGPDVFTKNIDKIFLFTAATSVKNRLCQEMLPTLTAFRQLIHFMNVENKAEMRDIESAINRYIGTVIFDKSGTNLLAVQAILQVFRQVFSVFTLGLNSKNFVRDITSSNLRTAVSLLNGSDKSMGIKSSEFFNAYNYILKHGESIFTSKGRLNQLNLIHRMANMSYREIAGQLKTNKFAVKNIDSSFLFITSTGSDFLHRMALLKSYLEKLGAYNAYVEDKDGIVSYNMELDERFKILFKYKFGEENIPDVDKDAYIKARNLYIESLDNWRVSHPELKYGDKLPLALDPKQEASLKALSNNLYGAYDKEEQALVHSTLLGGAFFQFKTYGISRLIDWWRRPGQISIIESKVMKDEKGRDLWEVMDENGDVKLVPYDEVSMEAIVSGKTRPFKMEMGAIDEGRLQTAWGIATMAFKAYYQNSEEAERILKQTLADPMSRENLLRAMLDTMMALLIQGFIRITYPEEALDNMTEQDWWTRWSHAVLTGVAQDGPVWEVFNSVWGGGEIPVVSGMARWMTSAMGVINGDHILPALANTWGATKEFSGILKDL